MSISCRPAHLHSALLRWRQFVHVSRDQGRRLDAALSVGNHRRDFLSLRAPFLANPGDRLVHLCGHPSVYPLEPFPFLGDSVSGYALLRFLGCLLDHLPTGGHGSVLLARSPARGAQTGSDEENDPGAPAGRHGGARPICERAPAPHGRARIRVLLPPSRPA